jgi:quinone-modifying oxidoreductase subunit QmoC
VARQIRYQRDAQPGWAYLVSQRPGCENLFACMQCGTCSGGCPLSAYMDVTPRRIIAMVREGFRTDALKSQTIWLCASCYACVVTCPQKINITDVMYSLKREAIRYRLYPSHFPVPVLARAFYEMVRSYGRSSEFWVVAGMALRSNPLKLFSFARTGWHLFKTGRLSFRHERIRRVDELQRALTVYQRVA